MFDLINPVFGPIFITEILQLKSWIECHCNPVHEQLITLLVVLVENREAMYGGRVDSWVLAGVVLEVVNSTYKKVNAWNHSTD